MATQRKDILNQKENIEKWISEKRSKAYICQQLNCRPGTLEHYLKLFAITYKGNKGCKGYEKGYEPVNLYLNNSRLITPHRLKLKLLREGLKEHRCECCGNSVWMNKPIPLELHHINGVDSDNSLNNLQLLCPNCHAQTDNYRGRAKKHKIC